MLMLLWLVLVAEALHRWMTTGWKGAKGSSPRALHHGPWLKGRQRGREEGWLELAPRTTLEYTTVGGQLVVAPRPKEDWLSRPGLRCLLLRGALELKLVAELGPQHGLRSWGLWEIVRA